MVSTWAAPLRRDETTLLTPLPPDIYLLIFDHFFYNPDFQSLSDYKKFLLKLSLVCRFFHALVIPKLFKEFAVDGYDEFEAFGPEWLERAWGGDTNAGALLANAKDFTLSNWRDEDNAEEWRHPWWRAHFLGTFPKFSSLVQLHVLRTPLEGGFMDMVYRLPNLQILSLKECAFSSHIPPSRSRSDFHDRPLRVHEFQLVHVDNFTYYRDEVVNYVTTKALRVLRTTDCALACKIMESGIHIPLEALEVPINVEDIAVLSAFLIRCPTITELRLEDGHIDDEHPSPSIHIDMPSSALPNLKVLHCPVILLPQLLPKRPVETLNMVGNHDWMFANSYDGVDISPLGGNKSPHLQMLVVPFAMYSEITLQQFVPKVDTLVICLPLVLSALPYSGILKALCIIHNQHPAVRHLKLLPFSGINVIWAFDLVLQHQLITEILTSSFPSATHISFNEGIEWRQIPETKEWKPVMLAPEIYRSLLGAGEEEFWAVVNVRDFEGLFSDLFGGTELTEELQHRLTGSEKQSTAGSDSDDQEAVVNEEVHEDLP